MSLITRCPACGTLFKVVADQLKISQGWVRCGQCNEVFDAQEHMSTGSVSQPMGLTKQAAPTAPAPLTATPARRATKPPAFNPASALAQTHAESLDDLSLTDIELADLALKDLSFSSSKPPFDRDFEVNKPVVHVSTAQAAIKYVASPLSPLPPPPAVSASGFHDFINSDWINTINPPAPQPVQASDAPPVALPQAAVPTPSIAEPIDAHLSDVDSHLTSARVELLLTPSFVRQAQRAQRWRSPRMRVGLGLLALVLLGLLAVQVAVQERDHIAAMEPQSLPYLRGLCAEVGCRVQPLKQIEAIVVDASSFNKLRGDSKMELYKLSVSLKNASALAVAAPHIELSLQDAQDQSVLRRVLLPSELGAADGLLPARGEWSGSTSVQVDTQQLAGSRIAGYRVLAFYP